MRLILVVYYIVCCLLCNARSLKNKLTDLHNLLYSTNYGCIFITESWLNSTISDGLLDPQNRYNIFRRDRKDGNGGGLCVFIKRCYTVSELHFESLAPEVELLGCDVFGNTEVRYAVSSFLTPD